MLSDDKALFVARNSDIVEMTAHEACLMLQAMSTLPDRVLIVDPALNLRLQFDEQELLCPAGIWREEETAEQDAGIASGLNVQEKTEREFFARPMRVDGRELWLVIDRRTVGKDPERDRDECLLEQEKNLEIIKVLASEYTSLYYIDLTTDKLTPYSMNEETETTFGSVFRSGITYSEAYHLYVDKLIYGEDKKMMLNAGSVENIKKELRHKKTFFTQYRSADNKYSEMKFVKVGGDEDEPTAVALGFAEKDEEIRREQQIAAERQRNTDIIEVLASEYTSVYYIDLRTDELNPYTMNEETETTFGSVFRSGITYSEAYRLYVDKLIYGEDKKMMLNAGSVENIKKELRHKKTFLTQYRSADNKYSEMKFVKVGGDEDEPTAVALGFAEKDEEIRREQEIAAERQRNTDIIGILASEYTSVYYIDLRTDELNPYTMNEETETTFGSVFRSGIAYSEAYRLYVDKLIYDEDKKMMLNAGSVENIKNELRHKKTFLTQYRSADNKYSEMKFVKVGGDEDEPTVVALGFAEKDEEIRREQEIAAERRRNTDIIEVLASEYTSVYYIDLETDELSPYTMNEMTENEFGNIFRSGILYSEAYRMYVDNLIYSEDKMMMLKAGSIGNIMKELSKRKTFLTTYRDSNGAYCEMKFVKVGNEEGIPRAVALGFANKDQELRAKAEEEKILKRNIDIIEILASEYSSVYYIDLMTDELDPYTMNVETENKFGLVFRKGIKYTEAFRLYVDSMVHANDKGMMLKAGSVYNIIRELTNKKTFITRYRDNEGFYSEMKFVKVGNEVNPEAVALGFANRDEEIRNDIARREADARDQSVITGLSDDFGCVVYAGYDNSEIHYRFDPLFEKYIPDWSRINNFAQRLDTLINTIMHPDDRQLFYEATRPEMVKKNVERDGVYYVNFRTLIDGKITYYQAKFVRDDLTNDHVIAGFHNVDEATKREMDALERAEIASKAKSKFLFSMSHDIRTPMNAIVGFTSMALKYVDNREKACDYLHKIETAGNQLLSLINQVLEMSRIESGRIELHMKKTDLKNLANELCVVYSGSAEAKDIQLIMNTDEVVHKNILADEDRLKQILTNIIGNSIKYTPANGQVSLTVKEMPGKREDSACYVFTVKDNGIGMSRDYLQHVFEEFSRENTSTVSKIQGTGLGMSIVKQLTDIMGGKIDIRSEKGKGTEITVMMELKIDESASPDLADDQLGEVSLSGLKVLLTEDNELNREIAEEILSDCGIFVDTAEDGDIAVEKIRTSAPGDFDLVLMDIQMPRMDGYTATRMIRSLKDKQLASIPIIAMTANAFEEDRRNAIEAGMNAHLAKPVNIGELKKTLAGFAGKIKAD